MMKRKIAATVAVLLLAAGALAQAHYKRVKFPRGRTTAILKGTLPTVDDVTNYALGARAGQTMTVHVTSPKGNARVSVYREGRENALEGANTVKDWSGELPESGDYVIAVVSMQGRASYTLEVTIR